MNVVIIESPFRGETKAEEALNRAYLEKCIRWCVLRNFTPYASHKMLTDALNDADQSERDDGIRAGIELSRQVLKHVPDAKVIFFEDYGMSHGMALAEEAYINMGVPFEFQTIGDLRSLRGKSLPCHNCGELPVIK